MNGLTYVNFPDFLTEANDITIQEKMTLIGLLKHKHGKKMTCYPSLLTLGKYLGRSIRSVSRYLKSLKEKGYIEIYNRGHKSNMYKILCAITWDNSSDEMVLLTEDNCEESSSNNTISNSINSMAKKAIEKVNNVVKRNTNNWNNNKSNNIIRCKKDEYSYDTNKIREMMGLNLNP